MKYRGDKKFYCVIGIGPDWVMSDYKMFELRLFFLIKRPLEGERMRFGKNYIGINWSFSWEEKSKKINKC